MAALVMLACPLGIGARTAVAAPAAPAAAEGADLLRRVRTIYGQNRRAIRNVAFDFTGEINGNVRQSLFVRDGERFRMAGVNLADGKVASFPDEVAWDGQVAHRRGWRLTGVKRSRDKERANWTSTPPDANFYHIVRALGLQLDPGQVNEPGQTYRFLRGRAVDDPQHGSCVELEFAASWEDFTLFTRHPRRYAYAPVYLRYGKSDGSVVPYTEITEARFAAVESDGNTLYYPVELRMLGAGGQKNGGNTFHDRVDESTLKINQPIPRSRFVIEPWPNENLYDESTDKLTHAKDPSFVPIGKVDFPWNEWLKAVEGPTAALQQERIAAGAVAGGVPRPSLPWAEGLGTWVAFAGLAIVLGGGYVIYRRRHPRQQQTLGEGRMITTSMSRAPRRRAFSIPELIVVMGLIMLLLGLLAPATSRAWRQAEAIKCRSQLRQLGLALAVYANENRGAVMPFGMGPDPQWPEVLFGEPNPPVVVCPTGAGEDTLSYQLNWWLKFGSLSVRMDGNNSRGLSPSQIPVAGESWAGRIEHYCWINADGVISWDPARHGPGLLSNYLWLDLHVDNSVPQPIPPSIDPWRVLRSGAPD